MMNYPERSLNPPEDKELTDVISTEIIEFEFSVEIEIDEDGDWEAVNADYSFVECPDTEDGCWYGSDHPSIKLADADDTLKYLCNLLPHNFTNGMVTGIYQMCGCVKLVFSVTGIKEDRAYCGCDEYGDPVYDIESYTDDVDVEFNKEMSVVHGFKVERKQ